jgi:hypothetical protein
MQSNYIFGDEQGITIGEWVVDIRFRDWHGGMGLRTGRWESLGRWARVCPVESELRISRVEPAMQTEASFSADM